ncbi:MAG: hypothetical protein NTX64_11560 [Elusimicrobia bacterium]|nr:hypothetical protein [Elusimicrobiota bacterium]
MTRPAAVLLALAAALSACGRAEEPEDEPRPALSREGSRWQVTRGDRPVMTLTNAPGVLHWSDGEVPHPFVSGEASDRREEPRLKNQVRRAHHFRDLINRLARAGYGVAEIQPPPPAPGPSSQVKGP